MGVMPKSIFTKANKKNNDILSILSNILTHKLNKLYKGEKLRLDLGEMFCACDSSTIKRCLSLYLCDTFHLKFDSLYKHSYQTHA